MKIFVSHNAKDKDTARLLATMFTDRGISVWFDQWEIKPGESITGGIEKGLQECDVFLLMWSAAAKASKWVDTELRAAIRKRVDDAELRLVPIMIDDTPLPLLLADYRGFKLDKADDLEDIVREICPNEAEIDVMARHQQRFLELVANQYPPGDEVRDLICPVCASRNLNAMVRLEPLFDERLCVVRCADCGWEQQAKGDCPWVQIRPFKADLGAATATGFLLVADPVADSIVRGTLLVLGRENITFAARGDEPFEVAVLGVTIVIKFDAASQAFSGSAQQEGTAPQAPTIMVGLG